MTKMTVAMMEGWVEDYEECLIADGFIKCDTMDKMEERLKEKLKASKIMGKHINTNYNDVIDWMTQVDYNNHDYHNNYEFYEREQFRLIIAVAEELNIDLFSEMKEYYYANDGGEGFEQRYGNL